MCVDQGIDGQLIFRHSNATNIGLYLAHVEVPELHREHLRPHGGGQELVLLWADAEALHYVEVLHVCGWKLWFWDMVHVPLCVLVICLLFKQVHHSRATGKCKT